MSPLCWGEHEQAPHRWLCCGISLYILYIYLVRCAVSHFRLLICAFLHLSLFQKLFTNYSYSARRHQPSISLIATARTETTRGPTYSMARTIGSTAWQKGFICRCHYLCCHSIISGSHSLHWPTSPVTTSMRAIACHKRLRECHLSVDTSCKAHGVLALCACSNHTDRDLVKNCLAYIVHGF